TQQPGHVHGGGPGAELDEQRVRDEAALGDPQVDVEEREYEAADPHAEHRLSHQPGREHALVTQGLEPEPFRGERDQIREEQEEGEQDDQHDQAQATSPTRRQTGYAQRSGHERYSRGAVAVCLVTTMTASSSMSLGIRER